MAGKGKGKDEGPADVPARYDDELLSANWNPVIELLDASSAKTLAVARSMKHELREEEVDDFLGRIYTSGN